MFDYSDEVGVICISTENFGLFLDHNKLNDIHRLMIFKCSFESGSHKN